MGARIRGLWSAAALSAGAALAAGQGGTTYTLDADAAFTRGCFPPCLCPVLIFDDLAGSFELSFLGTAPTGVEQWSVDAVSWTAGGGSPALTVAGTGLYERGGPGPPTERLRLDLSLDGGPVERFDSGVVAGGEDFPRIDLVVSKNGMVCFDEVFAVHAGPPSLGQLHCGATAGSTGLVTTIAAVGSATVADDDLLLLAHGAPAGQPGLFFFGPGVTQTPFGDGFLCVGGPLVRVQPPQTVNADGNALQPLSLVAPPAGGLVLPGTSWSFQFWFRDPLGGPAGFNLSEAVRVDFQ